MEFPPPPISWEVSLPAAPLAPSSSPPPPPPPPNTIWGELGPRRYTMKPTSWPPHTAIFTRERPSLIRPTRSWRPYPPIWGPLPGPTIKRRCGGRDLSRLPIRERPSRASIPRSQETSPISSGDFFGMFPCETLSVLAPHHREISIHTAMWCPHAHGADPGQPEPDPEYCIHHCGHYLLPVPDHPFSIHQNCVFSFEKRSPLSHGIRFTGNLDHTIKVKTNDEMGYLADTLNYMSSELGKMEEYQKSFIANVSHDFRSPDLHQGLSGSHFRRHHPAGAGGKISGDRDLWRRSASISLTEGMLTLNSLDSKGLSVPQQFRHQPGHQGHSGLPLKAPAVPGTSSWT